MFCVSYTQRPKTPLRNFSGKTYFVNEDLPYCTQRGFAKRRIMRSDSLVRNLAHGEKGINRVSLIRRSMNFRISKQNRRECMSKCLNLSDTVTKSIFEQHNHQKWRLPNVIQSNPRRSSRISKRSRPPRQPRAWPQAVAYLETRHGGGTTLKRRTLLPKGRHRFLLTFLGKHLRWKFCWPFLGISSKKISVDLFS